MALKAPLYKVHIWTPGRADTTRHEVRASSARVAVERGMVLRKVGGMRVGERVQILVEKMDGGLR